MIKIILATLLLLAHLTAATAEDASNQECQFDFVKPSYILSFPKDHGAHKQFPTEWWYFTGHLEDNNKNTYGFELTFFRVAIKPCKNLASPWESSQIYIAHAAVTDDRQNKFYHDQLLSRDNFGLADSSSENLDLHLRNWSAKMTENNIRIQSNAENFAFELNFNTNKAVVLHGDNAYSQKLPGKKNASYYTSFTRLLGNGSLTIDNQKINVTQAQAWMDHEIISSDVKDKKLAWDWFAIQLDDDRELMLYNLKYDGNISEYSQGTIIEKDGQFSKLKLGEYQLKILSNWESPKTGILYPSKWLVEIPSLELRLILIPSVLDQELDAQNSTNKTYWEGRHRVYDFSSNQQLGAAYVELVGY